MGDREGEREGEMWREREEMLVADPQSTANRDLSSLVLYCFCVLMEGWRDGWRDGWCPRGLGRERRGREGERGRCAVDVGG